MLRRKMIIGTINMIITRIFYLKYLLSKWWTKMCYDLGLFKLYGLNNFLNSLEVDGGRYC